MELIIAIFLGVFLIVIGSVCYLRIDRDYKEEGEDDK